MTHKYFSYTFFKLPAFNKYIPTKSSTELVVKNTSIHSHLGIPNITGVICNDSLNSPLKHVTSFGVKSTRFKIYHRMFMCRVTMSRYQCRYPDWISGETDPRYIWPVLIWFPGYVTSANTLVVRSASLLGGVRKMSSGGKCNQTQLWIPRFGWYMILRKLLTMRWHVNMSHGLVI